MTQQWHIVRCSGHSCGPVLLNDSNLVSMQGAVAGWLKAGHAGVLSGVEIGLGRWEHNQVLFSGADRHSMAGDGIVASGSAGVGPGI